MKNTLAMYRLFGSLTAIVLMAGCGGQASVMEDGRGPVHTIGVIAPLTGNGVNVGRPYVDGLQAAMQEHNDASDVFLMRLAVQDGRLDPAESVAGVQALLAKDDPAAFAVVFGLPAIAVSPILQQAEKLMMYEAYIERPLENPFAFKTGFDAHAGCKRLVEYAKKNGKYRKLGLLMARVEYSEICAAEARTIEPDLTEIWYEYGLKDFRSLLYRAHEQNVDTLLVMGIDYEMTSI